MKGSHLFGRKRGSGFLKIKQGRKGNKGYFFEKFRPSYNYMMS
jgi:hypothetical protein